MDFSQKLKRIRKENGMSQEELASQLSVSRQAVSKWESGQGFPETDKLLMISNMFSVSLDYLLKDNGDEEILPEGEAGYYVSRETANGYLAMKRSGAQRIALGVAVLILSLSFTMLFEDALGTFLFFLGIAAGVAILVLQGFRQKRYEEIEQLPLIFEADFLTEFRTWYGSQSKRYGIGIATGIVLIIVSFALNILFEDVLNLAPQYEAVYPIFWASGVAILIINGSALISSGILAKNKEHIEELKREQRGSWIFGVGFLLAAGIFIFIGIVWDLWDPGWIIFPVTGLLCTAITVWKNSRES